MRWTDALASLALHAAALSAVVAAGVLRGKSPQEREPLPFFFEIVEEAVAGAAETPPPAAAPAERSEEPCEPPPDQPTDATCTDEAPAALPPPDEVAQPTDEDVPTPPPPTDVDNTPPPTPPDTDDPPPPLDATAGSAAPEERAKVVADPSALGPIVPVYPRSARRKGHEGNVTIEVALAEDGGIAQARVVASSGFPELDTAALDAVRSARFAPATEDGVGVRGQVRLTFDFRLR